MKRITLLLVAVFALSVASMAQERGQRSMDPEKMAERQTEELTKTLGLSEEQQAKVLALNTEMAESMKAMREETQGEDVDRDAMREKMKAMREKQDSQLKEILTDAQYKKYEKYLEERRGNRGQRGSRGDR